MPALAPALQPDPCALGSRRGHPVWLGSGRISPAGGFNTPTLLGTTDFTLHDPKHRICPCPSVPAAAGAVQAEHGGCWGRAWPTVTRTRGQRDSWLYPEPRDTAQGSPTTAEGDGGRDELALRWPFASQVLEVGRSPLQGPARPRHQPPQREVQCVHRRKLSDKPLFPQEQVNSMQRNRFLLLLLQPRHLGPGARLCHAQTLHRAVPSSWARLGGGHASVALFEGRDGKVETRSRNVASCGQSKPGAARLPAEAYPKPLLPACARWMKIPPACVCLLSPVPPPPLGHPSHNALL